MKENKLRRLLNEGLPSTSTRISSTWPFMTEAVGLTGNFDYIEFLAEYAPFSQIDLENIVRAAELYDMGTMIKVGFQNRGYIVHKAITSGFQAIMFADHRTPEEVHESVRLSKPETPEDDGLFGYPNSRFVGARINIPQIDHAQRIRETVLCFMIEKKQALDNIEEICSIPGVDMVQFGPSDFSLSCGWNKSDHVEDCKKAERKMIEVALKHGVQPRCEIMTPEAAKYYIDLGVKHISMGDQVSKLREFWIYEGEKIRKIADSLK
jgi:2-keto-3-deoxy-L-rhamnonate aldolase RhmA